MVRIIVVVTGLLALLVASDRLRCKEFEPPKYRYYKIVEVNCQKADFVNPDRCKILLENGKSIQRNGIFVKGEIISIRVKAARCKR
jgi:hypothetical protein